MIKLLRSDVLILPKKIEKKQGGIILPNEEEKESREEGTVKAIGPEVKEVKVGDHVMFIDYAAHSVVDQQTVKGKTTEQKYRLIKEADVLCILTDD